jgi:far upstream element-binding protein
MQPSYGRPIDISHIRPINSGTIDISEAYRPRRRSRSRSPRRFPSPPRHNEPHSETLQIESSLVGLIIGRQGENMRKVEADTGARVQFLTNGTNGPLRECKISGTRQQVTEARDAIYRIIADNSKAPSKAAAPSQEASQIMVPDRTVGLIIGRGGETIRDLQERSGCHINIVGEQKSVNGLRPVNLIGSPQAAALAKELILEIVASDEKGAAPVVSNEKINDSIRVPSDAVGLVIGKGGETIKEIQASTGCKVNVSQPEGPNAVDREIGLVGTRDSIERAKQAIEERISGVVSSFNATQLTE